MFDNFLTNNNMPFRFAEFGLVMVFLVLWSLVWKGFALWKAAKNDSKAWFVALLIINTAGILEILYYFVFSKMSKEGNTTSLDPEKHL